MSAKRAEPGLTRPDSGKSRDANAYIGLLVLLGNGLCFILLFRHRSDNLNMRSIWPDVLVGGIIAVLFLRTALTVLAESVHEYREVRPEIHYE